MIALEPLRYPRMHVLGSALAIAVIARQDVDFVLAGTHLGQLVAQDAILGLLPCSGDYSAGHQGIRARNHKR